MSTINNDASEGNKITILGEVLSIDKYDEIANISDKDVEIALTEWREKMGSFSELVDAVTKK